MNKIRTIVEPKGLVVSWQAADGDRSRFVVAEITRKTGEKGFLFRYLVNSPEYKNATKAGFRGYPAFSTDVAVHEQGVIEAFMARLPNRSRADFGAFLEQHRLPASPHISDIALLGYTGARLPGDSFELVPVIDPATERVEFVLEACGFRYQGIDVSSVEVGQPVDFVADATNRHDRNAVAMFIGERRIGYINRVLAPTVLTWLRSRRVTGSVDRINGRPDRPMVYVFLEVRESEESREPA